MSRGLDVEFLSASNRPELFVLVTPLEITIDERGVIRNFTVNSNIYS